MAAEKMYKNNPILNTVEKRMDSLHALLELLNPNVMDKCKQVNTPFIHFGPKLAPTPKEKEVQELEDQIEEERKMRMVGFFGETNLRNLIG
jgi:hypothetical protein